MSFEIKRVFHFKTNYIIPYNIPFLFCQAYLGYKPCDNVGGRINDTVTLSSTERSYEIGTWPTLYFKILNNLEKMLLLNNFILNFRKDGCGNNQGDFFSFKIN